MAVRRVRSAGRATGPVASTRVSSKGQVIIPKAIREARGWDAGVELTVVEDGDRVVLARVEPEKKYKIADIVGILQHNGPPVSIEEMNMAIDAEMAARWARKSGKRSQ